MTKRKCAAKDCKVWFKPMADWGLYHAPRCAWRERSRRYRAKHNLAHKATGS